MNKLKYAVIGAFFFSSINAQIQNGGFENSTANLPKHWDIKKYDLYDIKIDSKQKHTGKASLQLIGNSNEPKTFQNFSQSIPLNTNALQKIEISAYIKSESTTGNIDFWAQLKDSDNKIIDFRNFISQGKIISANKDWTKYTMTFFINRNCKELVLGGTLYGSGTVWFDDFEVHEVKSSEEAPSETAVKYIDRAKTIMKTNSIFTDKIDWNVVENDLALISKGMQTTDDTTPALTYLLQQIKAAGDNHSFIESKERSEKRKVSNPKGIEPEYQLIDQNIGYISVPGFSSSNKELGNEFALKVHDMIKKLDSENNIKGWIVDLRNNTGGTMYPMIAGLGNLTGEGILGYFAENNNKKTPWNYQKGKIVYYEIKEPYSLKNPNQKIAVLIGPKTASAGEITAIAFIGKNNTKLFGQPTRGLTTGNKVFPLSDGRNLVLSSSYDMDRNGKAYQGKISPDVSVESSPGKDMDIEAAKKWIVE
ncbi:MAG: S41 family peptidase [Chryseobacterium jejuense]|uniref:S41 family peptidase n=1 Tax=Chryseobacterium jejuense TaxID=445960 RepID=UPI003D1319D2